MTNPLWRAIVVIMLGLFAFEMMGVIVRTLGSDYPILQISVLRNFFGIIPAALLLMLGPGLAGLKTIRHKRDFIVILLRSGAVLMAQISFYTALTKIEFATAGALGFTSPLFITLSVHSDPRHTGRLGADCRCYPRLCRGAGDHEAVQ